MTPAYEDPAEWILKEADLPANVTPAELQAQGPRGAPPHRPRLRPRPDHALRLHPARSSAGSPRPPAPAGARRNGSSAAASSTSSPATARSASACRSASCPTSRRRPTPTPTSPTRPSRAAPSPTSATARPARRPSRRSPSTAPAPSRWPTSPPTTPSSRSASSRSSATPAAPSAPPSPSSRATAASASSCPRSRASRTTSTSSPPPRPPPATMGLPIHIEGYAPPPDPRLNVIRVAPDPGVIEVNIHPAASWDDCVAITTGVYEEARQCRLGADKFMIDGKHTGTGGGNHVVVGGGTTLDSPFLRRPDLLRSAHPALAAPPVDLLPLLRPLHRPDLPGPAHRRGPPRRASTSSRSRWRRCRRPARATPPPPWLVDRLLRNLLVDVTGNTHRAEICIDKLYSPDGPTGRLGLVEFRGFEMPPDPRMSLAQQLLIRALIARLWHAPRHRHAHPLGHRAARPLHAAALRLGGLPRRAARPPRPRLRHAPRLVRGAGRVPLPVLRRGRDRRRPPRAPPGARALARPRRDRRHRRHRPLHRQLGRAPAGQAHHHRPRPLPRRLQPPPPAAAAHRHRRRRRRRRPLQGLAARRRAAPGHPGPRAADLRHLRHLDRPRHRRLHLPRRPPRRPQLRHLPGQRQRGRGPPPRPLRAARPHRRRLHARRRERRTASSR